MASSFLPSDILYTVTSAHKMIDQDLVAIGEDARTLAAAPIHIRRKMLNLLDILRGDLEVLVEEWEKEENE